MFGAISGVAVVVEVKLPKSVPVYASVLGCQHHRNRNLSMVNTATATGAIIKVLFTRHTVCRNLSKINCTGCRPCVRAFAMTMKKRHLNSLSESQQQQQQQDAATEAKIAKLDSLKATPVPSLFSYKGTDTDTPMTDLTTAAPQKPTQVEQSTLNGRDDDGSGIQSSPKNCPVCLWPRGSPHCYH